MLTHGTMGGQWQAVIVLVVGLTSLTLAGCQRDLVRSNDLVYSEAVEHTSDIKLLGSLDSGLVPMGRIQYGKGEHAIHDLNAFMAAEDGYSSHAMAIYHVPAPTLRFGKVFFAFKHARKFSSRHPAGLTGYVLESDSDDDEASLPRSQRCSDYVQGCRAVSVFGRHSGPCTHLIMTGSRR